MSVTGWLKRPDLLDESKILSRDPETNCARNDEIDQKLWNYEDWIYIKSIDTDSDKVQYDVSFFYDEDYGGAISDTTDYGSVKILNHFSFIYSCNVCYRVDIATRWAFWHANSGIIWTKTKMLKRLKKGPHF